MSISESHQMKPFDIERYWKKRSLYYHVVHDIDVSTEIKRLKKVEEDVIHQKEAAHVTSLKEVTQDSVRNVY